MALTDRQRSKLFVRRGWRLVYQVFESLVYLSDDDLSSDDLSTAVSRDSRLNTWDFWIPAKHTSARHRYTAINQGPPASIP